MKEARRKWVEANHERDVASKRAYYEANRDAALERAKQWRDANPEKLKAAKQAYYEANREALNQKFREWNKANPERAKAAKLAWSRAQTANGNNRIRVANRRAKMRAAGGSITKADVEKKFVDQAGKCAICDQELLPRFEIDHILPVALDGPTTKENIQLLCRPCNRWKWHRHPDDIRGLLPPHARPPEHPKEIPI